MNILIIYMFVHYLVLDVAFLGAMVAMAYKKNKIKSYVDYDIQKGE